MGEREADALIGETVQHGRRRLPTGHRKRIGPQGVDGDEQDVLIGGGVGMGIRESDNELRDKFNAAIISMKADGSLNELITKWFKGDLALF